MTTIYTYPGMPITKGQGGFFIPVPKQFVSRQQREEADDIAANKTGAGTIMKWCLRVRHDVGVLARTITLDSQDWRERFFIVGASAGATTATHQWENGYASLFEGRPSDWTGTDAVTVVGSEDHDPSEVSMSFTVTIGESGALELHTTSDAPSSPRPVTSIVTIQVVVFGPFNTTPEEKQ